ENRSLSLPFISLHFCIGETFIISPHKSLNISAAIIISPYSLDFSRDIAYLFINYNSWLSVGIARAVYAVPGHFCFGVLMGYYYSLSRFPHTYVESNRAMALFLPILAHGIYDALLFMMRVNEMLAIILFIFFLLFCNNIWKFSSQKIEELLKRDAEEMPNPNT
ncbi:MAG: PrsW family intramembrane metalloprotease, partial [Bacteroidaceae bacterium]|nr:PrsW family intramembrane metalloprotease [Bacteroidaceae bacterium]